MSTSDFIVGTKRLPFQNTIHPGGVGVSGQYAIGFGYHSSLGP